MRLFLCFLFLCVVFYYWTKDPIYALWNQYSRFITYVVLIVCFLVILCIPTSWFYHAHLIEFIDFARGFIGTKNQTKEKDNRSSHPKHARRVSTYLKKWIGSSQEWKCALCDHLLEASYEIDHIKALEEGGTNEISNLRALCRKCHGEKTFMERISQK